VVRLTRVYPKVSGPAAWSKNFKWYSSLPLGSMYHYFVSQSSDFCRHKHLCCFSTSVYCCKRIFLYDSVRKLLDTPSYFMNYERGPRIRFPAGAENFSLHHRVQNGPEVHSTSYPMGTRALSLRVKRLGREADHSPPSSAEVKE
jgi:hypothetical protein